jgi:hypothetical protein
LKVNDGSSGRAASSSACVCLAFKRCVTTFLSRERESDEHQTGNGNWSIVDQGVRTAVDSLVRSFVRRHGSSLVQFQTTVITGYVFDGIKGYNVPNYVFDNQASVRV